MSVSDEPKTERIEFGGITFGTATFFEPGTAYAVSKCADPATCHLRFTPMHAFGIHDAVKIEGIGD